MSDDNRPVSVTILEKDYVVACTEQEREPLFRSVGLLDRKMRDLRDAGKIVGTERVAVMAALHLAHELLECRREQALLRGSISESMKRLEQKVARALATQQQAVA